MSNIRFITLGSLLIVISVIVCCIWGCGVPRREHEEIVALNLRVKELQEEKQRLEQQLGVQPAYSSRKLAVGQHKLVLLSLSENFSSEQQTAIRNTLLNLLTRLQKQQPLPAFSLQVIQPGRRIHTILKAEELAKLPQQGQENSLQGKIERGLQFSAQDLRALDDLELVDLLLQDATNPNETIGQILYLTDNARLNTNPQDIPNKQRGIPLAWREDGIILTIVTTQPNGCEAWQYVGVNAQRCTYWQGQPEILQKTLINFLEG